MTVTLDLNAASSSKSTLDTNSSRKTLYQISQAVAKSRRVVVVTGAGISCSCGIPDFRSTDGLYNLVKSTYPNVVVKGRDLFDSSLFRDPISRSVFYTFIAGLKEAIDNSQPSPTHRFIKTLNTKGKLLRSYTQNIDGLEEQAGIIGTSSEQAKAKSKGKGKGKVNLTEVKNVLLHGDIHRVRCTLCSVSLLCEPSHLEAFKSGVPPDCPECTERSSARVARSQRSTAVGTLRPAIVLYDEPHPLGEEIGEIQSRDLSKKPDLLIIMGTSLKVHGLKKLVKEFAAAVHASTSSSTATTSLKPAASKGLLGKVIFINKTPPPSEWAGIIDYHVQGTTDDWTDSVIRDWRKIRPSDWETQKTLLDASGVSGRENGAMKVVKNLESSVNRASKPKLGKQKTVPSQSHGWEENVDPQSSQQTLVGEEDPFGPGSFKAKVKRITLKKSSRPSRPLTSSIPLSPSKRMNRSSSSRSDNGSLTDVEIDSDTELGSPRKKRNTLRIPDEMGDISMRSDAGDGIEEFRFSPKNLRTAHHRGNRPLRAMPTQSLGESPSRAILIDE